jgi:hypothetical protein
MPPVGRYQPSLFAWSVGNTPCAAQPKNLYRTTLRPAGFGGLPQGVTYQYVETPSDGSVNLPSIPVSRLRYGVIKTDRPLTADEMQHFDIVGA